MPPSENQRQTGSVDKDFCRIIEGHAHSHQAGSMWTSTSYPDARIWNNRVAALAGSFRSTGTLGLSAALAISEATIYGRGIDMRAIEFLIRTRKEIESGAMLADCLRNELAKHRSIAGYGRPIINGDERNPHILELANKLGLNQGAHLRVAFEIEEALLAGRWRMKMNYGGLAAALAADMGFLPQEYYLFMFPAFLAGMPPVYIEASEAPEGSLFPTRCDAIAWEGAGPRDWPTKKTE